MKRAPSRAKRFANAQQKVAEARCEIEELMDELQNWYDSIPENLQDGDKANTLEESIQLLEEHIGILDEIENSDVEFPGMFG